MKALVVAIVIALIGVIAGTFLLPRLPPEYSIFYVFPVLLLGVGLLLQGYSGFQVGAGGLRAEHPIHLLIALFGVAVASAGLLGTLRLAPAGAYDALWRTERLEELCAQPASQRPHRELLPLMRVLGEQLPLQNRPLRERLQPRVETALIGCEAQLQAAFDDPKGTHGAWRRLRDWWVTEGTWHPLSDRLQDAPFRPRIHRPQRAPVSIEL